MSGDVGQCFAQHCKQLLADLGRNQRVDGAVEADLRVEAQRVARGSRGVKDRLPQPFAGVGRR